MRLIVMVQAENRFAQTAGMSWRSVQLFQKCSLLRVPADNPLLSDNLFLKMVWPIIQDQDMADITRTPVRSLLQTENGSYNTFLAFLG